MSFLWNLFSDQKPSTTPSICYHVRGFLNCVYYEEAACVAKSLALKSGDNIQVHVVGVPRKDWKQTLDESKLELSDSSAQKHRTSPFIFEGCGETDKVFIGRVRSLI